MSDKKDLAGEDKEPQLRGKAGPATSTPNEEGRARAGDKDDAATPKIGKGEAARRDSGGGLH